MDKKHNVRKYSRTHQSTSIRLLLKPYRRAIKFTVSFSFLIVLFYLVWFSAIYNNSIGPRITAFNAFLSSKILNILGLGTNQIDNTIYSEAFSIGVSKGCDGIEAMAVFTSALLSYPLPGIHKIRGFATGIFLLFGLNLIRIISLFLIGLYFPSLFELIHKEIWPVAFILAALGMWGALIYWSTKEQHLQNGLNKG
jgi:exosortase/archaeosortase family protein